MPRFGDNLGSCIRLVAGLMFFTFGIVAGALPVAAADSTIVGQMRLDIPDFGKWTVQKGTKGSGLLMQRTIGTGNGENGGAILQIAGPFTQGGFDANFETMAATIKELKDEDVIVKAKGETAAGYPIQMRHVCCGYRGDVMLSGTTVGVGMPDGQYFLMLLELNLRGDISTEVENDFAAAVRTLRVKDQDEVSLPRPDDGAGGLEGVFSALRTGVMPNVFGGMDFRADNIIMVFDPSGYYASTLPPGDTSIADYCAAHLTDCGTYKLSGGGFFSGKKQISITETTNRYGIIEARNEDFSQDGDKLAIGSDDFHRIPPFDKGTSFNGSWTYTWASSGMTAMSSGSVAASHTLVMKPDGSFKMTGWSGFSSSNDIGDSTTSVAGNGNRPDETGHYEADGYNLILTGDDGARKVMSIFEPDVGSDGLLVIDGNNFLKDDD